MRRLSWLLFAALALGATAAAAEKGVILSLAPSPTEQGEAVARICARLLRGDNPSSISPEVPSCSSWY